MNDNNLMQELLNEAISERIRKTKVEFLNGLEHALDELFKRDLNPKQLKKELVDIITKARADARFGQYYINM